jgi:hypothetical protein
MAGRPNKGKWKDDPDRQPLGDKLQPWAPGNVVALTHGAESERMVAPVAARLVEQATADAPYLTEPKYTATLEAWSRAEARVVLLEEWLSQEGLLTDEGDVRRAAEFQLRCERHAAMLREQLGLTPLARARLGRDVSSAQVNLGTIWAELARREKEQDDADTR